MAASLYLEPLPERHDAIGAAASARGSIAVVPWRDMIGDVASWDRLADRAAEPNPFYESWYLLPSLHAFGDADRVSMLRFELDGELAGLMPLHRTNRYYHLPMPHMSGWVHANCFLGTPLVAGGAETAFWAAMLDWADANAGLALFLHLRAIPIGGPVHAALEHVLARDDRPGACVHRKERAMLRSDRDSETYWQASVSAKKRKELRRQLNRLAELGDVRFVRETGVAALGEWTDMFLALEASGWKGRAGSALASDPRTEALFRKSLDGAAQRDRLERLSLLLDGRPIAMLASFIAPPGAFSYKTAFDEAYARFSPGVLLQRENLALLDRDDVHWCDSCAASDHPMIDHIWRERLQLGRFSIGIGGPLRRAAFRPVLTRETLRMKRATAT